MEPTQQNTPQVQSEVVYAQKPPKAPMNTPQKIMLGGILAFGILWFVALGLPAYLFEGRSMSDGYISGLTSFILGPFLLMNEFSRLGSSEGISSLGGLAWLFGNGLSYATAILGIIAIKSRKSSVVSGLLMASVISASVAFLFSLLCLTVHEAPQSENDPLMAAYPGPAAYLWIVSMLCLLIMTIIAFVKYKALLRAQQPATINAPVAQA